MYAAPHAGEDMVWTAGRLAEANGNDLPTHSLQNKFNECGITERAHLIEVSGIMQCGPTVLNTGGGETLQVPKTTGHSTAASAAQAGSLPTSDPAFSMVQLSAYKYGVLLQVARELIDDTAVFELAA
jgi:Phage capsid family